MRCRTKIEAMGLEAECEKGTNVLALLRSLGIAADAPCGGNGKCGGCTVTVNGEKCLACSSTVEGDSVIVLPESGKMNILGAAVTDGTGDKTVIAVDIGTTTVACSLIKNGRTEGERSALNPQRSFGADVVSRLRSICPEQTRLIRKCVEDMILSLCEPSEVDIISVASNPAMQQIFLGLGVDNLMKPPYKPLLKKAEYLPAEDIFPGLKNAKLLVIPQIGAYAGADTLSCVMATGMYRAEKPCLLVDIGTNAEIVLGCREKLICCTAAAGPALEGADISCGMRAERGAIDHVYAENGRLSAHVIGDGEARGICGSGIIDAAAALLEAGRLNARGRIIPKTDGKAEICGGIALTQSDIEHIQLAKGAICGGILTLLAEYGIEASELDRVYIAGAFGSYINADSACRIGLLPAAFSEKTVAVGNASLLGAAMLAAEGEKLRLAESIAGRIGVTELEGSAKFRRYFAESMYFDV